MSNIEINYPPGDYEFSLSIGYLAASRSEVVSVPAYCAVSEEGWLALTDDERETEMNNAWGDWSGSYIDGGFRPVEGAES